MAKQYQEDPGTINFSKISTYLRCPLQYYFRYVMKIKTPPTAPLTFGSAFHKAVEHNYRQKIDSKKDLKTKEVQDKFAADFEVGARDTIWQPDEDKSKMLDLGVLCVSVYHDDAVAQRFDSRAISPQVQPSMVEEEFEVNFENMAKPMKGTIDLVDQNIVIRDTKTTARTPGPDEAFKNFQLTTYTLGYKIKTGKMPKGIALDYVVKTKAPKVVTLKDQRSEEDIDALLNTIGKVEFAIEHELWYPNPHNFMCGPKGCGNWEACQAGRKVK
ncbi:MAG TPA: PD-(D/E)XK nuclease family protein [Candidatus Omnitrophota bacterium]|nr:PD-(D/E)XK nuclease family protein [Candidatus Omnitrophota bacterium]